MIATPLQAMLPTALRAARRRRRTAAGLGILLLGATGLVLLGCKDLTGSQPLPAGTVNPASYSTPSGALGLRGQALYDLQQALPGHLVVTGLLTDELQSKGIGASAGVLVTTRLDITGGPDARLLPEESYGNSLPSDGLVDADYAALQHVRSELGLAAAAIAVYDTGAKAIGDPRHLRAELVALEGYTEILLADFFCSGVPLSTLDFQQDYTYHAGSRTDQVYQDAIAKEDSALAWADTSPTIQYLARVLKGRALLDLGGAANAAAAAQLVAPVPDGFQYQMAVQFHTSVDPADLSGNALNQNATVADTEGRNGLPYRSSGDPRTAVTVTQVQDPAHGVYVPWTFPRKYRLTGFSPFVVASGVEARLIQAEATLQAHDVSTWLTQLNQLRTTGVFLPPDTIFDTLGVTDCGGSFGTCGSGPGGNNPTMGQPAGGFPVPAGYALAGADTTAPAPAGIQDYCNANSWYNPCWQGDTMVVLLYVRPAGWPAGTGGVSNLAPLSDPGTDSARVALLFRERAFWLFLTGERQGDLRRLLRQYGSVGFRQQDQVYPTGPYTAPGTAVYGTDVTAPIPGNEYLNPLFHGCLDRNP